MTGTPNKQYIYGQNPHLRPLDPPESSKGGVDLQDRRKGCGGQVDPCLPRGAFILSWTASAGTTAETAVSHYDLMASRRLGGAAYCTRLL
jgi:hypothetical protein